MTPSITSKKVLNTILKKEKVNGKEKDQKVEKVEKVKALRVMEKTPNTTLKEKVVEKVKVTGDPKKTGKEKTGDPKEEKEKNTTSKKKMMMIWDQDQKVKVVKEKAKVKVEKVKAAKVKAAKVKEVRKVAKEKKKTPSITSKKVMNNKDSEEDQDQVDLKKAQKSMFTNGRVTILVNTLLKN